MNTQHKEIEAYTERHIDSFSIVLVKATPAPKNHFQKEVCEVLQYGLHGLVFPTDDFQLLKRNILQAIQHIDKYNPRKNRRISTIYSELGTDSTGRLRRVNNLDIGEIVQSKDIFERSASSSSCQFRAHLSRQRWENLSSSPHHSIPTVLCGLMLTIAM